MVSHFQSFFFVTIYDDNDNLTTILMIDNPHGWYCISEVEKQNSNMIRCRIVKIPCDINQQLVEEELPSTIVDGGDVIPTYLQTTHVKEGGSDVIIDTTPLIRLDKSSPGLYAYVISSVCKAEYNTTPNIRATRLSLACGCHSNRFVGDVWIGRLGYSNDDDGCGLSNVDVSISDINFAVEYSPDLRITIQQEMQQQMKMEVGSVPDWLGYASQKNYHDGASIQQLAVAMTRADIVSESSDGDDSSSSSSSSENETSENITEEVKAKQDVSLTNTTLCLHCRGPASTLCQDCGGAYFCNEPRKCTTNGCVVFVFCSVHIVLFYDTHLDLLNTLVYTLHYEDGHTNVFVQFGRCMLTDEVNSRRSIIWTDGNFHCLERIVLHPKQPMKSS